MRAFLWLCFLAVGCGSDRFEAIGETPGPTESTSEGVTSAQGSDSEDSEESADPVNVNVNVEVNVDGKPAGSASATNGDPTSLAPSVAPDGGADSGEFIHLPIPTSYVPRPPSVDGGASEPPAADADAPLPEYEPVPAIVLGDAVESFREWFLVGYNFDSQRLTREELTSGGYAARAVVEGNRDYTLTGTLFDGPSGEPRDAQDFDGVAFWVCGNVGALRFEVPTTATKDAPQSFGKLVDVTRQWQLVTVRWSDLGQDTPTHTFDVQSVRGLYFTVVESDYELWLHAVQFWTEGETLEGSSPTGSCL